MRLRILRLIILSIHTLMCWTSAVAQPDIPTYSVMQLDNRDGLSNSAVNCVLEDRDGMLWIGTWDGLNRYDGHKLHVFSFDGNASERALISNVVLGLLEDRQQHIWISTVEGVSRYDKATGTFKHFFYDTSRRRGIGENGFGLVTDTAGQLFARTPNEPLMRYEAALDTFIACPLPGVDQRLSDICIDDGNRLWVLTTGGEVLAYTATDKGFQSAVKLPPLGATVSGLHMANGFLFVSTAAGHIYRLQPDTFVPEQVSDLGQPISAIGWYGHQYYISLTTQGLQVFDPSFVPQPLPSGLQPLQGMKIRGWSGSQEQLLWVATDGNGFVRLSRYNTPFRTLSPQGELSLPPVRAFAEVDGDLWVGTKGGGISVLDDFIPQRAGIVSWQSYLNQALVNRDVFAIVQSKQHQLVYVGTDGKGLSVYDKHHKRLLNWSQIGGHTDFPEFGSIYAILEDPDGSLWIGTSGYGLLHLRMQRTDGGDLHAQFIRQYRYDSQHNGLANDIVYSLCFGVDNQLWIACRYGGLSLLDKVSGHLTSFRAFSYENSLSNNDILSLYRDTSNRLWVGTSYGLNWLALEGADRQQPAFEHITASEGLPNNTIHAITADESGHIWVSTNRGLARINPSSGNVAQFQETDGLHRAEFSDGAVWKDAFGFLYFGGIHGFSYFNPFQIPQNSPLPNVIIQNLRLGNRSADENRYTVLNPEANSSLRHTLPRRENFFTVEALALSYLYPDRCEYAWMLEGHDQDWQYGRTGGNISYSSIPPGSYQLVIKWSNGSGLWTAPIQLMQLRVAPFWWQTWPVMLGTLLLLVGLTYWWYANRKNKLHIQHRLQLERTLREKDEMLHEKQLNFFTNIAHELQTPLTLLVGTAEQLENQQPEPTSRPAKWQPLVALLKQQASRLTYLVQQLLEFRKAQAGHIQADYRYQDVSMLLNRLGEIFHPLSAQQYNTYELHIPDGLQFTADADKLEKIIFNLLSNAFKHSGMYEHITFSARKEKTVPAMLHLQVANSGCRLAPTENERIFEQFQSSPSGISGTHSTGIGLAFTRELVNVLGGTIGATIEDGWITFDVVLPIPDQQTPAQSPATETALAPIYTQMATPATHSLDSAAYNKVALLEKLTEAHKKSVLVVEDDPDIRFLIRQVLHTHYIIYEASDGLEAIGVLQQHPPDLIISDVMMPGMDGITLCDKVKNTPATCHIPIIMLSAKGTLAQRNEGFEAGADAYLGKPFHASHLLIRVRNLLEQRARLHKRFRHANSIDDVIRTGNPEEESFLEALVVQIMQHLDDPELNASTLEAALSLSKMQLYRKLKTISGMTPSEFIRHIRIKQATQLLVSTTLTVNEIFYKTGFNNQSYFFRAFKKQHGCSPNEYRNRIQIQS